MFRNNQQTRKFLSVYYFTLLLLHVPATVCHSQGARLYLLIYRQIWIFVYVAAYVRTHIRRHIIMHTITYYTEFYQQKFKIGL
jgi:hypothetical protein